MQSISFRHNYKKANKVKLLINLIAMFIPNKKARSKFRKKFERVDVAAEMSKVSDTLCRKMSLVKNDDIHTLPNGIKIYCPLYPCDYIQRGIVNKSKFYEVGILEDLMKYIPKDATILDIGANIGNHSVYWATIGGAATVHAFEPVHETYRMLKKNIEINELSNIITAHNIALGGKRTASTIDCYATENIGGTSVKESAVENKYSMEMDALDNIDLGTSKIDFMKIDVEGFEVQALNGMKNTLAKFRPIVFIESFITKSGTTVQGHADEVKEFFKLMGYNDAIPYPGHNWLFLPNNRAM